MLQYDASNTELRPGDIVVVPEGVARQTLSDRHRRQLVLQEQVAWSANWDIGIRTMTRQRVDGWAGDFYTCGYSLYSSPYYRLWWRFFFRPRIPLTIAA